MRLSACTVHGDRQAETTGLLKSSLLTKPQFLPEIGELNLLTHELCPRERGGWGETHCTGSSSGGSSGHRTAPPLRGTQSSHRPRTCCHLPRRASCRKTESLERTPTVRDVSHAPCRAFYTRGQQTALVSL